MWPFESSKALCYKWSIVSFVTMRLPCTIMKIWHLKDNGITTLTFWGHVTSSVTWPFDLLWATFYGWSVHCDHMASQKLDARRGARTDAYVILYSVQCYGQAWTFRPQDVLSPPIVFAVRRFSPFCTVMEIWRLKSWTHAGAQGRTLMWFYTLSNAMHCIGQTIILLANIHLISLCRPRNKQTVC